MKVTMGGLVLGGLVLIASSLPVQADNATPLSTIAAASSVGSLKQLQGTAGCVQDKKVKKRLKCGTVRALSGPGAVVGTRAVTVSPDNKHVYVAAARSNAVAVLKRNPKTGALSQSTSKAGCVSLEGKGNCRNASALQGPNSVAISKDGDWVFVSSATNNAVTSFLRNPKTGALTQKSCVSAGSVADCGAVTGLSQPDSIVVSPDGDNVYVGSFAGASIVSLNVAKGALSANNCIAAATQGCASGLGFGSVESVAITPDGKLVIAASPSGNSVLMLNRDTATGALTQATDGTGCWTNAPVTGCTTGRELGGADDVAVSEDGKSFYTVNLTSQSVAMFRIGSGVVQQAAGADGCLVNQAPAAVGCRYIRQFQKPEGVAASRDGRSVYGLSLSGDGGLIVLSRAKSGSVTQLSGTAGCVLGGGGKECGRARAITGASAITVSPDGRNVYVVGFKDNAVAVFKRKVKG